MFYITVLVVYITILLLTVDLLATSGDISQSWTSPMYMKLYSNNTSINPLGRPITKKEDSWIGSLVNIGAILGSIPAGLIADKIGRRKLLMLIALPHIASYLTFAFAREIHLFYIGRLINGISMGAGYAILPMYIAEVTEDSNRASLSSTLNIFWTFGNFIPYGLGPYVSVKIFNLIIAAIPSTFLIIFLLVGIETPHYLVQVGKEDEAEEVVRKLRSCNEEVAKKEIDLIRDLFKRYEDGNVLDILKNQGLKKALLISLMLVVLQQFSGVNALSYYMEPIFEASGSSLSASVSSTIVGICMFIFSCPTTLVVERTGKKWPLGVSFTGCAVSLISIGAFFYIKERSNIGINNILWLPIAGLVLFQLFFNVGLGSIPWTISSELFPNKVKAISSSAVAACCWSSSFVVTKFFNLLNESVGMTGTFWIYSGSCLVGLVFEIIWVPETKGKSFMEIQEML